jgi:hypothetical protein
MIYIIVHVFNATDIVNSSGLIACGADQSLMGGVSYQFEQEVHITVPAPVRKLLT